MTQAPALQTFTSGASSTKQVRLELVWFSAIEAIARRGEYGITTHGPGAVNGLTPPGDPRLVDREFLLTRLSHAIGHAYALIHKLIQGIPLDQGVDDPAAFAWAGALICEANLELKRQELKRQAERAAESAPPAAGNRSTGGSCQ